MGLVLEYVQELASGSFRYRRRVPTPLVPVLGKREVLHHLGKTKKEALRAYPSVHTAVERLFRRAVRTGEAPVALPHSEYAAHNQLVAKLRGDGFDPHEDLSSIGENHARQQHADALLDAHERDPHTGEPLVPLDAETYVRALYNGVPPKPAPTLRDAMRLYLTENVTTDTPEHVKKGQRVERVVANAIDALGGDRKLTEITWHDARAVCAHFLALHPSPQTTRRYLNDLMGIAALSIKAERMGIANPFAGIEVQSDPTLIEEGRKGVPEKELEEVLAAVKLRLQHHASPDLRLIWTLLEHTGCRGKEITGLSKADVFLDDPDRPYIVIRWTANRRLKSLKTARGLPLLPVAAAAAKEALRLAGDSPYLFPNYHAGQKGADRASAALGKHLRVVTKNPDIVTYSLRHRVKGRLIAAGVPEDMQERIIGHGAGKISRAYGLQETERSAMAEALGKAFPEASKRSALEKNTYQDTDSGGDTPLDAKSP